MQQSLECNGIPAFVFLPPFFFLLTLSFPFFDVIQLQPWWSNGPTAPWNDGTRSSRDAPRSNAVPWSWPWRSWVWAWRRRRWRRSKHDGQDGWPWRPWWSWWSWPYGMGRTWWSGQSWRPNAPTRHAARRRGPWRPRRPRRLQWWSWRHEQ